MELKKTAAVLMADGSTRKISDIHIGDKILNPNGNMLVVENVFCGAETVLVSIMTITKEELCMSMSSFVETERGIISARDLQVSDSVKTINGFVKLEEMKVISNEAPVYLLLLNVPLSRYIVNGSFIVGDMSWMMSQKR